jgi:hypothetical protein
MPATFTRATQVEPEANHPSTGGQPAVAARATTGKIASPDGAGRANSSIDIVSQLDSPWLAT